MNFLKGIVDGILADDVDRANLHGVLQRSFIGDSRSEDECTSFQSDPHARKLDDIYREERRNCITSLLIRYGEGCVQQLNELLKTNNATVKTLAEKLEDAYRSLGDFNNELESLTQENVRLQKSNAELMNQLDALTSENVSLKSVIANAELETKSQEARLSDMSELLRDNAAVFHNMQSRCEAISESTAEVESLKMQLATAQSHIEALIRERDALVDSSSNTDNRIKDAMRRQDRAIAIAKLMAQETKFLSTQQATARCSEGASYNHEEITGLKQQLSEFKAQVDQLSEENAHLKDVNDKLHNMFADLSNNCKRLKEAYLLDSIESLGKRHLKQLKPIQLIFIQPTRVLDLDLDLDSISAEMSEVFKHIHRKEQGGTQVQPKQELPKSARLPQDEDHVNKSGTHPMIQASFSSDIAKSHDSNVTVSSESKQKEAWGGDWDVYDEILQEELQVESSEVKADEQQSPRLETVAPVKSDMPKPKNVWNDDLDELLKEESLN